MTDSCDKVVVSVTVGSRVKDDSVILIVDIGLEVIVFVGWTCPVGNNSLVVLKVGEYVKVDWYVVDSFTVFLVLSDGTTVDWKLTDDEAIVTGVDGWFVTDIDDVIDSVFPVVDCVVIIIGILDVIASVTKLISVLDLTGATDEGNAVVTESVTASDVTEFSVLDWTEDTDVGNAGVIVWDVFGKFVVTVSTLLEVIDGKVGLVVGKGGKMCLVVKGGIIVETLGDVLTGCIGRGVVVGSVMLQHIDIWLGWQLWKRIHRF